MQTDMRASDPNQTTPSDTAASPEPVARFDLARWRANMRALTEEIRANKRVMRAPDSSEAPARRGAAQARARELAQRATALCIGRAATRGRVHAPGLSLEKLRGVLGAVCPWARRQELRLAEHPDEYRRAIVELIKSMCG